MDGMASGEAMKFTMADSRSARASGRKMPMLTCYDFSTARLMEQAGVPAILVGDSAANVILGHPTTLPVPLDFMIETDGGGAAQCAELFAGGGYAVWVVSGFDGGGEERDEDGATFAGAIA